MNNYVYTAIGLVVFYVGLKMFSWGMMRNKSVVYYSQVTLQRNNGEHD